MVSTMVSKVIKCPNKVKNVFPYGNVLIPDVEKLREKMKMRGLYKTDIETAMYNALKKNSIEFTEQFPVRCKYGYIIDMAIPKLKIAIECDGEHWHKDGNARDRKRNAVLRKMGWKILRFRGNEIQNNIAECISTIQENIDTQIGERRLVKNGKN